MQPVTFYGMVGSSAVMHRLYQRVRRVAPYDIPVLISGESGTGKELVARAIHAESDRRNGPFYAVNTGALTLELIKSELFGHEKGAFTGATERKQGFFEIASGGTLFLDEIGTMDLSTQVNLLRVIESREFVRVGGTESQSTDVRIVAATNTNLRRAVSAGDFRRDLYYRLNVFALRLPALRHRTDDIPQLIEYFRQHIDSTYNCTVTSIEPEGVEQLVEYRWPGNVRELLNVMTQLVIGASGPVITAEAVNEAIVQAKTGKAVGASPSPLEGQGFNAGETSQSGNNPDAKRQAAAEAEQVASDAPESSTTADEVHAIGDAGDGGAETSDGHGDPEVESIKAVLETGTTIGDAERKLIEMTLESVAGNRSKAARILGISRKSLYNKLKAYEIEE